MRTRKIPQSLAQIMPALIRVQAHLDEDLSLEQLAREAQLSSFHFHRLFRKVTGETPKAYVERLRLERAALQLRLRRATVMEVALECGYRNHETFTRAYRAHFGVTPRAHRAEWSLRARPPGRAPARHEERGFATLSSTRVVNLAPMTVAFIRHLGPYEQVQRSAFDRLLAWARRRGMLGDRPLLLGIAHDAPGITPSAKLRFDCCIQVPAAFAAEGDIGCQATPSGAFAMSDYVGSWDLGPAYATIFERLHAMPGIEVIGLPAIEIFQATRIAARHALAQVSIAIPVAARSNRKPSRGSSRA